MNNKIQRIGLITRLMVVIYDLLLLEGVILACQAIIYSLSLILPESIRQLLIVKIINLGMLIGVAYTFYGWFWVNGGQTLGMKAWHLYLIHDNGKFINWKMAAIRFISALPSIACFGMGFAWILINKKKLTWHDIASKSQIVKQKPVKATKKKQQQRQNELNQLVGIFGATIGAVFSQILNSSEEMVGTPLCTRQI